jgi:membrane associated rhomboid family serine protease
MGLERLARIRVKEAVLPLALVSLLIVFQLAGHGAIHVLRYERSAVLAGEAWRLVTGHLVHADAVHLAWNVLGVLIVGFLFTREYTARQWLGILLASLAAIDAGFLLLEPELEWSVGFSDPVTWFVTVLFAAKLAWEHYAGALPFTAGSLSLPVVHEAHTYGAVGGLAAALWLVRQARRPASL